MKAKPFELQPTLGIKIVLISGTNSDAVWTAGVTFPLTPALSLGERENRPPPFWTTLRGFCATNRPDNPDSCWLFPLPEEEYVFTVRAKNWHGARDLSRRNAGPAAPRWEIAMPFRQPTFLRTKARAPIAVPGETVNTYEGEGKRRESHLSHRTNPELSNGTGPSGRAEGFPK
jgi:hypothetical protein